MRKTLFQYVTYILGLIFLVLGAMAFSTPVMEQLPASFWHGLLLIILGTQLLSFWYNKRE